MNELEEWRQIPGFETYGVSNFGRVRGKRKKVLAPVKTAYGYHQVTICHLRRSPWL